MAELTADELAHRLFNGGVRPVVVDVRDREAFEEWHIPGSENIDVHDELAADQAAAAERLAVLPADREIVTVCAAGVVSRRATQLLAERGYDAKTLVDGMVGWSRVHRSKPIYLDVDGRLLQVARPGKGCLSYLLVADGEAAVFDPSHYLEAYEERLDALDAELVGVFDTHAHADHVSGGRALADRHGVPYHLHPDDAPAFEVSPLADGQTLSVGSVDVRVLHTPGHSPGSVAYSIAGEALLTGDTLFHRSVGRVELGVEAGIEDADLESNAETLYESLQRLRDEPGDPLVLPAHDPGTPEPPVAARLSDVVAGNRDLNRSRAEFVATLADDVPDHPPNFERIKRVNVGAGTIADEERSTLELGPNRCAAE